MCDAEPESLEAGRVVGGGVGGGHPGDGLGASGVGGLGEFLGDVFDLVDRLEGFVSGLGVEEVVCGAVGEEAFVVGIGPFAGLGVDPVVVDALADFLSIGFEFFGPTREVFVDSWFGEGVGDGDHDGGVF